jgi:hypothetical protein
LRGNCCRRGSAGRRAGVLTAEWITLRIDTLRRFTDEQPVHRGEADVHDDRGDHQPDAELDIGPTWASVCS